MSCSIYVVQHKQSKNLTDDCFVPIWVGAKGKDLSRENFHGVTDDTGDNISHKNDSYCELTAMYWVWKNAPKTDYVGFMHYRRHLDFTGLTVDEESKWGVVEYDTIDANYELKNGLNMGSISQKLNVFDMILPRKWDVTKSGSKNTYDHYRRGPDHIPADYDKVLSVLVKKYPAYKKHMVSFNVSTEAYFTNMFVMKWEIFDEYCQWLFDVLFTLEGELDISSYSVAQRRVFGFLSEWLFNIWVSKFVSEHDDVLVLEVPRTFVVNTESNCEILPVFASDFVPVVMAFDEGYVGYAGALIQSIVEHASSSKNYDLIVFSDDLTSKSRKLLDKIVREKKNISLRIFDVSSFYGNNAMNVHMHFSKETYYRLKIPDILKNYEKVVYIDSDTIVQKDLWHLYEVDMGDKLIAAVKDYVMAGFCKYKTPSHKNCGGLPADDYLKKYLNLKRIDTYFQAGVIVFNNVLLRKSNYTSKLDELLSGRVYWFLDQDILNMALEGRVHFLDPRWNTLFGNGTLNTFFKGLPGRDHDEFFESLKDPYIIHFAGDRKPWFYPDIDFADVFWSYSRKTPWYELNISRIKTNEQKNETQKIQRIKKKSKIEKWVKSTLETLRAIGYLVFPFGSRRRQKRRYLMDHLPRRHPGRFE